MARSPVVNAREAVTVATVERGIRQPRPLRHGQHPLGDVEGVHVPDVGRDRTREAADAAPDLDADVVAPGHIADRLTEIAPDAYAGRPELLEVALAVRAVAGDVPVRVLGGLGIPEVAARSEAHGKVVLQREYHDRGGALGGDSRRRPPGPCKKLLRLGGWLPSRARSRVAPAPRRARRPPRGARCGRARR